MIIDLNNYPESKKELLTFTKTILSAFQKMSVAPGVEMPPITEEIAEQFMNTMFTLGPKNLLDFFDEQDIYISCIYSGEEQKFYALVRGFETNHFDKRSDMEKAAFLKAFDILETTLTI